MLREAGIEAPTSTVAFIRAANELVDQPELTPLSRLLHIVLAEINLYEQCMAECEQQLKSWHADDEIVRKLDEVSGIGLLTASALTAAVGKPERFANGRQLSAWLGMTPSEYSSGERRRLGRISCKGNIYVRTLFIHGSRAALLAASAMPGTHARKTDRVTALGRRDSSPYWPQQSGCGAGQQIGQDLLGGVVS